MVYGGEDTLELTQRGPGAGGSYCSSNPSFLIGHMLTSYVDWLRKLDPGWTGCRFSFSHWEKPMDSPVVNRKRKFSTLVTEVDFVWIGKVDSAF